MIKIKNRKNPNLKGEEFIDDNFIRTLKIAWFALKINNSVHSLELANRYISEAITYSNIGENKCTDCMYHSYRTCECEKCDDCGYNRCMCSLDSVDKAKNFIKILAKKYNIEKEVLK